MACSPVVGGWWLVLAPRAAMRCWCWCWRRYVIAGQGTVAMEILNKMNGACAPSSMQETIPSPGSGSETARIDLHPRDSDGLKAAGPKLRAVSEFWIRDSTSPRARATAARAVAAPAPLPREGGAGESGSTPREGCPANLFILFWVVFRFAAGKRLDAIFVCCGGGGLLAGVLSYVKRVRHVKTSPPLPLPLRFFF